MVTDAYDEYDEFEDDSEEDYDYEEDDEWYQINQVISEKNIFALIYPSTVPQSILLPLNL